MFLLYRNRGERRYGLNPVFPYPRKVWEFEFFLEGRCTIAVREEDRVRQEPLAGPALVVTGPDCVHGWGGKPKDVCQVMVFHFDEADFLVRSIVGAAGCRIVRFAKEELPFLESQYERCAEVRKTIGTLPAAAKKRMGFLAPRIYGLVAMELTLFFLRHVPKAELGPMPDFEETKVAEALSWYEAHIDRNPTIAETARAVHISPTHLRRLFHKIRGVSPQHAFTQVQFERVKWLMRDPAMTLERIAEHVGFGSASAFSRAFTAEFGIPPRAYRETMGQRRP